MTSIVFDKAVDLIEKNDTDGLKELIEEYLSILKERDRKSREYLLHITVEKGSRDIVKLLIDRGADLNSVDRYDLTPLHVAVEKGDIDIVKLLLERGVDLNSKSDLKNTPLHAAATAGNREIARLLIDHGVDINAGDKYGETALHAAVSMSNVEIARFLLLKGADISVKDIFGETPLDYTEDKKIKNELLFLYHNREKILEEIDRQKDRGVDYDQF